MSYSRLFTSKAELHVLLHFRYFGFITKHPDQQRFACHVMMSETTLHPLAESVG